MVKEFRYTTKKLDYFVETEDYKPDLIDRRIISELSKNGRASYTEIADIINVTPATVRNRMNRLIESKIIRNFKPLVDKKLYNLDISALLMITLETSKITEDITKKLKEFPEITQISILANDPNIVCNIFAENMELFSMILIKITQMDGIKDVKSNFVMKSIFSGSFIQ